MQSIVLTNQERRIVEHLARGCTDKEIATAMNLQVSTIKHYLHLLKKKHPGAVTRYTAVLHLARDHERQMAVRLNEWMRAWGDQLSDAAQAELKRIMSDWVAEFLK